MASNCDLLHSPTSSAEYSEKSKQLFKFLLGGGVATLAHWSVMATFLVLSDLTGQRATSIGAAIGASINYLLQRRYVFKCSAAHVQTLLPYLIAALVVWLTNGFVFWVLNAQAHVPVIYAQLVATTIASVLSFKLQGRVFS